MYKYLLLFSKTESVRWLGHLDILRTFERAIRRADLPIVFSTGFNPREKITFVSALGVGITGSREPMTIELNENLDPTIIINKLNTVLPAGIIMVECYLLQENEAKELSKLLTQAEFTLVCQHPDYTFQQISSAIDSVLSETTLTITRQKEGSTRTQDIRPNLFHLECLPEEHTSDRMTLRMIVGQGETGTVRPVEVATALNSVLNGITPRRAHRLRLLTSDGFTPPLPLKLDRTEIA